MAKAKSNKGDKNKKKDGREALANLIEWVTPARAYQIDELIDKFDNAVKTFKEVNDENRKVVNRGRILNRWSLGVSISVGVVSLIILIIAVKQFNITKSYQEWARKEMLRSPNLSLEIFQIDTLEAKKTIRLHCSLYNRGDNIAKSVQILMPANKPNYPIELDVIGPSVMTISAGDGNKNVKIPIYKYAEIIYYSDQLEDPYHIKLTWVWEFRNLPTDKKYISWGYTIYCDGGSYEGYIDFVNPFVTKTKEGSK